MQKAYFYLPFSLESFAFFAILYSEITLVLSSSRSFLCLRPTSNGGFWGARVGEIFLSSSS